MLQDHLSYLQEAHLGRVRHAHRAGPRGRARRGPLRVQATLLDVLVHGELTGEKPAASADVRVSARVGGRSPRSASSEPARAPPMNRVPETRRSSGGDAMTMTARTRGSREDDETTTHGATSAASGPPKTREGVFRVSSPGRFRVIRRLSLPRTYRRAYRNSATRLFRAEEKKVSLDSICLLYTSPSPRDRQKSRMPSSA